MKFPILNRWRGSHSRLPSLEYQMRIVFDESYYLKHNPDVITTQIDPFQHYYDQGRFEYLRPSLFFDPSFYLEEYPDIAKSGVEPLEHYLTTGWSEGRFPTAHGFDAKWYTQTYPSVADGPDIPLIHFIRQGLQAGYAPNSQFDADRYLAENPDALITNAIPFAHYLEYGLGGSVDARTMIQNLENQVGEFQVILRANEPSRLNLVIDEVPHVEGAKDPIEAALRQSVFLAKERGQQIRILTRTSRPDPTAIAAIMHGSGIHLINLEFDYAPVEIGAPIEVSPSDTYLTTNWWNTKAVRAAVDPAQVTQLETVLDSATSRRMTELTTRGMAEVTVRPTHSQTGHRRTLVALVNTDDASQYRTLISGLEWACEHGGLQKENWQIILHGDQVPRIVFSNGNVGISSSSVTDDQYQDLLKDAAVVVQATGVSTSTLFDDSDAGSLGRTILEAVTQ